jgi:hypothetical protein
MEQVCYPMKKKVSFLWPSPNVEKYQVIPEVNLDDGVISCPFSSVAFLISKVAIIVAIAIQILLSAKRRPGHILRIIMH